jgi:hypothetical protein
MLYGACEVSYYMVVVQLYAKVLLHDTMIVELMVVACTTGSGIRSSRTGTI